MGKIKGHGGKSAHKIVIHYRAFVQPVACNVYCGGSHKRKKIAAAKRLFFAGKQQHGKHAHAYGGRYPKGISADKVGKSCSYGGGSRRVRCGQYHGGKEYKSVACVYVALGKGHGELDEVGAAKDKGGKKRAYGYAANGG